jgi:hypothetical protein
MIRIKQSKQTRISLHKENGHSVDIGYKYLGYHSLCSWRATIDSGLFRSHSINEVPYKQFLRMGLYIYKIKKL